MTNDYNENLLEYLTGNIAQGVSSATALYKEVTESEYGSSTTIAGNTSVRCKDGKGNYNGLEIYYSQGGSTLTLVDPKDMRVIKKFTTFSSGTPFKKFLNIQVDEVGNVYGIDYEGEYDGNPQDFHFRIILLNNLSEIAKGYGDYEAILRNSYFIQGYTLDDDLSPNSYSFLAKSTQSATYYFTLSDTMNSFLFPSTFQINVGLANTWTRLPEITLLPSSSLIGNIYFDTNDQPIAEYYAWENTYGEDKIERALAVGSNAAQYSDALTNIQNTYFYNNPSDVSYFNLGMYANYFGNFYMIMHGIIKDNNNQYKAVLKAYNVENNNPLQLAVYESPSGNSSDVLYYITRGKVVNNNLMLYMVQWSSGSNAKMCFTLLSPNNTTNYFLRDENEHTWSKLGQARNGFYNLYDEYIIHSIFRETNNDPYTITSYKIVYNSNGYNGTEYKDKTMLAPSEALLFDENGNLVFARSLYNLKVYNNQTMATLNVPNNLLNNETISEQRLYGRTNYELVESTQEITKNVYENVYINFVNAISMQNQNTANYSYNLPGASRLNLSCGKVFDYEEAKANKIRVTYDDNTYYVTSVPNSITNGVCTYEIGVHVPGDKNILKIEIISNDEITTYQTITNLNLTNNKYYQITQDVYVV